MKKMEVNSVEVAKLAGVSRSTVSRVINNYSNVPPQTREKVMRIIEQYQYVPNASAQVLAGKKTKTIGLFFINRDDVSKDILSNMLIVSVIEYASSLGYYVLTNIIRDPKDAESMRSVKEIFYQRRIDGGIFIGAANHEPFIEELIAEGYYVGIIDYELEGRNEANRIIVNFDSSRGMEMAVQYLAGLHHREIGIINGDMRRYSAPIKYHAYLDTMSKCELTVNHQWVLQLPASESSEHGAYLVMKEHVLSGKKLPTAFVAVNDGAAFGAIRAMQELGVRVPEEVSVIGFDDHFLSERFQPPLTTIKVDFNHMMDKLTEKLIATIEGRQSTYERTSVTPILIERESCKERR